MLYLGADFVDSYDTMMELRGLQASLPGDVIAHKTIKCLQGFHGKRTKQPVQRACKLKPTVIYF